LTAVNYQLIDKTVSWTYLGVRVSLVDWRNFYFCSYIERLCGLWRYCEIPIGV